MSSLPLEILLEDNHLLVINKPSNLATMGVSEDEPSLWRQAKEYLRVKYNKPGNVYLGVVSRLDARVSGAVLFARTSKAAARLNEQFRARHVAKLYWAIVAGRTAVGETLTHYVAKNEARERMEVVSPSQAGAQQAILSYRKLADLPGRTLIEIELQTGRKHQIRLQLSHRGHPILGDVKYDSHDGFSRGIALHSRSVAFEHPIGKTAICCVAPLPAYWPKLPAPATQG